VLPFREKTSKRTSLRPFAASVGGILGQIGWVRTAAAPRAIAGLTEHILTFYDAYITAHNKARIFVW